MTAFDGFTYTLTQATDGRWVLRHSAGNVTLSDGSVHRVQGAVAYSSYDRDAVVSVAQSITA